MWTPRAGAALLAAAMTASSCLGDPPADPGPPSCTGRDCCEVSQDCLGWQTCDAWGFCITAPACDDDRDCLGEDVCSVDRWCAPPAEFDPASVAILGSLKGSTAWAVAPLERPSRIQVGVPFQGGGNPSSISMPRLTTAGELLYLVHGISTGVTTLRRFVPDRWTRGPLGDWAAPLDDNDVVLATPACAPADFVVRAGTGEVLHTCTAEGTDWYDTEGILRVTGLRVLAWDADGRLLLLDPSSGEYRVRTGPGDVVVTGLITFSPSQLRQVRTAPGGFRLLVREDWTGRSELWFVTTTGVLEPRGSYPQAVYRIDGQGRGYGVKPDSHPAVLFRCLPGGASCPILFDPLRDGIEPSFTSGRPHDEVGIDATLLYAVTGP